MKAVGSWMFCKAEMTMTRSEVQPVYSHKKWEVGPAALSAALDVLNVSGLIVSNDGTKVIVLIVACNS